MRDDNDENPCISFPVRKVQPATKLAKARAEEEEKGARSFGPAPIAVMEGWRIPRWLFTPRAESAVSTVGPVAEEKSNLCYMFGMANDEEPVEKALVASSPATITSADSVNSNLAILMVDSGASGHSFKDAIIRDLEYRLQDYVHFTLPLIILLTGGVMLDGTVEGALQGLVTHDNGNQILARSISW